jgi:prephenate dehydrogenase
VTPRPGVLGLGLIGGSLLKALSDPVGADSDPAVAGAARAAGFTVVAGAADLARECDVVIVCVPPPQVPAAVAELLAADTDIVVADTASVKATVLREVGALAGPDALARFVPAHPLAGAESAGWAASDPALLRDAVWAICPPAADAPPEPLCRLAAALAPLGARLLVCDAAAHDAAVARTSHVPHVVAQALARAPAGEGLPLAAALSGGAYRDMTRTARSDPRLWLGILGANRAATAAGLHALIADLHVLADALEAGDDERLAAAWREGAAARATVDAIRWSEPDWHERRLAWPAWEALLALGRNGVLVRGPRMDAGDLALEVGGENSRPGA